MAPTIVVPSLAAQAPRTGRHNVCTDVTFVIFQNSTLTAGTISRQMTAAAVRNQYSSFEGIELSHYYLNLLIFNIFISAAKAGGQCRV